MSTRIAVLGAGSWGTTLAILAATNGCRTLLWGHDSEHINALRQDRENKQYLPGHKFPETLTVTDDLKEVASFSRLILVSVPSHAFKTTLLKLKTYLSRTIQIAWATKGFNTDNGCLLHEVISEIFSSETPAALLSGPSFAKEVAAELPTAITLASSHPDFSNNLANILRTERFRIYTNSDLIGVEVGGAVKNVMAIAAGIADGLGFGANTRAALITRGLTEMIRLGVIMGGKQDTFMGLAGLGDLILTCTDNQSRNRRLGLALGKGQALNDAMLEIGQEIEGISASKMTYLLARKYAIEMPITEQTYKVLYEHLDPKLAVQNLLAREQKAES